MDWKAGAVSLCLSIAFQISLKISFCSEPIFLYLDKPAVSLYTIRLKPFYVSRGYSVTDSNGVPVFRINGKVRFARTFVIEEIYGSLSFNVREKLLAIDPTYIVTQQGKQVAKVCRTTTSGKHPERFTIDLGTNGSLIASGSLVSDITIRKGDSLCARIWREQETIREAFGFETTDDCDLALLLSIAMSIVETDTSRGRNPAG